MKPTPTLLLFLAFAAGSLFAAGCASQPSAPVDREFQLHGEIRDGKMVYVGDGGEIDGLVNPQLVAHPGERIRIILASIEAIPHDVEIDELHVRAPQVSGQGQETQLTFTAGGPGDYSYFCTVSGHRPAGMEGKFIVIAE